MIVAVLLSGQSENKLNLSAPNTFSSKFPQVPNISGFKLEIVV